MTVASEMHGLVQGTSPGIWRVALHIGSLGVFCLDHARLTVTVYLLVDIHIRCYCKWGNAIMRCCAHMSHRVRAMLCF